MHVCTARWAGSGPRQPAMHAPGNVGRVGASPACHARSRQGGPGRGLASLPCTLAARWAGSGRRQPAMHVPCKEGQDRAVARVCKARTRALSACMHNASAVWSEGAQRSCREGRRVSMPASRPASPSPLDAPAERPVRHAPSAACRALSCSCQYARLSPSASSMSLQ